MTDTTYPAPAAIATRRSDPSRRLALLSFVFAPAWLLAGILFASWASGLEPPPASGNGAGMWVQMGETLMRGGLYFGAAAVINLVGLVLGLAGSLVQGDSTWRMRSLLAALVNAGGWLLLPVVALGA